MASSASIDSNWCYRTRLGFVAHLAEEMGFTNIVESHRRFRIWFDFGLSQFKYGR